MQRVGEHPVPAGPLAVRWIAYELGEARAGLAARARLRLANAGSAPWRSVGREGIQLSYHWLDPLGNPIVWDGPRRPFEEVVRPGEEVELETAVLAPRPPGSYRLAFDLVSEYRYWFEELGSATLDLPVEVRPRIEARRLGVQVHGERDSELEAALAAQEEPLVSDEARRGGSPRSGCRSRPRLVAPDPRRARRGIRSGRARARAGRAERASPPLRVGARRRSQPALRPPAATPVGARRDRGGPARGPARLRRRGRALRGPCRDQTSVAIRSSERLKTSAPRARATPAAATV